MQAILGKRNVTPGMIVAGRADSDLRTERIVCWTVLVVFVLMCQTGFGDEGFEGKLKINDRLPYGQQPIDYFGPLRDDPIALLQKQLASGRDQLQFELKHGYLRSLLKLLNVPVESQLLVFSKTAVNHRLVSPHTPRALYFNDEVAVGWSPGAASLEILSEDPRKGSLFYLLNQDSSTPPNFRRQTSCLACHISKSTLQIPGPMLLSSSTDETGKPTATLAHITHQTPFPKRWAGWYVTGSGSKLSHSGNLIGSNAQRRTLSDLKSTLDESQYLSPHSDVVAHLILDHQVRGRNLLTRVNYESRLNRHSDAEEQLLRYLLFVDEAPLEGPIRGTSGYADWFGRQGPMDSRGRSLRELNLQSRVFKYRLSYLIYSRGFDAMRIDAKERLYRRLWEILTGKEIAREFRTHSAEERRTILEILRETKDDLPAYWDAPRR